MGSSAVSLSRRLILTLFMVGILLVFVINKNNNNINSNNNNNNYKFPLQLPHQTTNTEYSTSQDGDQVQAIRRQKIIQTCMQYKGQGVLQPMNPYFATKFWPASLTLDEDAGLGWCRVGKVATSPWSALFLLLQSVSLDKIRVSLALHSKETPHDLLKKAHHISKPNKRIHMVKGEHGKEYFTFFVVRHPFVRLVSAYRDKLENLTEYNVRHHVKDAPRMTSRRVFNSSVADSPTFPEFVDYLIRSPPNLMDKHWAPYTKVCSPCTHPYSAVLKMETLEQDSDWMFNKLRLEQVREDWEKVAKMRISQVSSAELVGEYFRQLSKDDIVRLYNKYKVDFVMFDYDKQVEDYVEMGRRTE